MAKPTQIAKPPPAAPLTQGEFRKSGLPKQLRDYLLSEGFQHVKEEAKRRRSFRPGTQPTAHEQHFVSGFSMGFDEAFERLLEIATETEDEKTTSFTPARDPDLA